MECTKKMCTIMSVKFKSMLSEPKKKYMLDGEKKIEFMRDSASGGIELFWLKNWVRLKWNRIWEQKYDSDFCPHIKAENSLEGIGDLCDEIYSE